MLIKTELQISPGVSGSVGFSVYFCRHWYTDKWPEDWIMDSITKNLMFLGSFPILVVVGCRVMN